LIEDLIEDLNCEVREGFKEFDVIAFSENPSRALRSSW
jgi:hypothetical protein